MTTSRQTPRGRAVAMTAALLLLCAALTGCEKAQRGALIHAPNHGDAIDPGSDPELSAVKMYGVAEQFRLNVGPPEASLRVWVFDPTDAPPERLIDGRPRGTIVVLHGYRNQMFMIRGWGKGFADAGYRVAMIDMRGHGRSSGDFITYGVHESRDVRQLIDELERRGLIIGPLGLWGISMGGATALMEAADDPRVATVVSVASYTTMRAAVPHFARNAGMRAFDSDDEFQPFIDAAGEEAGFDPDDADALAAVSRMRQPVLIIHGTGDSWIPPDQARTLFDAAPPDSRLLLLSNIGHLSAHFDFGGAIEQASIEWFDAHADARPPDHADAGHD